MSELVVGSMVPFCKNSRLLMRTGAQFREEWQCRDWMMRKLKPAKMMMVKNQMTKPATYSSRISTDIPLYESPGASFDQYLEHKPRVFRAIFPDKRRSQRLNEDVWRIHMVPIDFLLLTVWPVIDMRLRCKSGGIDYPPGVPQDITKPFPLSKGHPWNYPKRVVLEQVVRLVHLIWIKGPNPENCLSTSKIRWELQGLDEILKPSEFTLGVKGALYPDRRGARTSLKGQLKLSISFVLPPVLAMVPDDVRRDVAESVLKRLVENMKHKVNGSLIADYSEFKREEKLKANA